MNRLVDTLTAKDGKIDIICFTWNCDVISSTVSVEEGSTSASIKGEGSYLTLANLVLDTAVASSPSYAGSVTNEMYVL